MGVATPKPPGGLRRRGEFLKPRAEVGVRVGGRVAAVEAERPRVGAVVVAAAHTEPADAGGIVAIIRDVGRVGAADRVRVDKGIIGGVMPPRLDPPARGRSRVASYGGARAVVGICEIRRVVVGANIRAGENNSVAPLEHISPPIFNIAVLDRDVSVRARGAARVVGHGVGSARIDRLFVPFGSSRGPFPARRPFSPGPSA